MLRFLLATVVLLPLALHRRGSLRPVLLGPAGASLGLTGVAACYGLQNLGLMRTTPGTAALLQALLPIVTALLAMVFLRERLAGLTVALRRFADRGQPWADTAHRRHRQCPVGHAVPHALARWGDHHRPVALAGHHHRRPPEGLPRRRCLRRHPAPVVLRRPAYPRQHLRDPHTASVPVLGYAFAVLLGEPPTWAKTTGGVLAICGITLAARVQHRA